METNQQVIEKLQKKNKKYNNGTMNAVEIYKYLIDTFDNGSYVNNNIWQNLYAKFFVIGYHSKTWKSLYFKFLQELNQKSKKTEIENFKDNLEKFYYLQKDNKLKPYVETSFISKAMHMLNHDLPIWDSKVRKNLLNKHYNPIHRCSTKGEKIKKSIELYKETNEKIQDAINKNEQFIKLFREEFPNEEKSITDVKIMDFYYWIIRPEKKTKRKTK